MRTEDRGSTKDAEAAFAHLFEQTSARVYSYVRRHCDDADCDDIVAEVFLVAWRRFEDVPPDPLPWLLTASRHLLWNHWRSRDRRARLEAELRAVRQLAIDDPAGLATERSVMLSALEALSPGDRELLLLVGWDGLDTSGVSQVLNCSPTAVTSRLNRARRRLEEALRDRSNEPLIAPDGAFLVPERN